ncbi:MAG: Phosphoribosylglycinamide synthetase [Candidatus Magasanikbacteria bacterium GW2011_GWA2_37_8]|uniref:Glycinamide ribonucleotide synthetase n=1 Tax=Candidatus Magasanikbacteria bacterium GW2011_GWA2_37_8 TaxID=1619036 RepID=A0A0G0HF58_9BACT|nr:MAG: Phosphoribosylglycinamide synthetase [Candidatus Magasanikbacteria bacterium GW2011_GWA2_37_8]
MKILFISGELIAADLAYRLQAEGCEVKMYIEDEQRKDCFENIVEKTTNWQKELTWVGKDGLIVFDDIGFGKEQDNLRKKGYLVVGGSAGGDDLEKDRVFGQKVCSECGLSGVIKTFNFNTISSAIEYVRQHPNFWVIKQNSHFSVFNYIGEKADGSDVIKVLENYQAQGLDKFLAISLQEKVAGIEISVARYFNGLDWLGPIEYSIEHKRLLNNDLGPFTPEMGTVMWYNEDEGKKLYQETLAKIKPFLQRVNFKGDVAVNCLVDKDNFFILELTTRFGSPEVHLQMEIHNTPWKDFLLAVAKGEKIDLDYKKGYGLVVSLVTPPFPYFAESDPINNKSCKGAKIIFKEKLTEEEWSRVHFEEVSKNKKVGSFFVAGGYGSIMHVTGFGKSVVEARTQVYDLIDKIEIPQMMYRTDIGENFLNNDERLLQDWGWV